MTICTQRKATGRFYYEAKFGPDQIDVTGLLEGVACAPLVLANATAVTNTGTEAVFDTELKTGEFEKQSRVLRRIRLFQTAPPKTCEFPRQDPSGHDETDAFAGFLRREFPGRIVKGPPPGARQPINLIEVHLEGPVGALEKLTAQLDREALRGLFGR